MQPRYLFSRTGFGRIRVAAEPPHTQPSSGRIAPEIQQAVLEFYGDSIAKGRLLHKSANGVTFEQTARHFGLGINTVIAIVARRDRKCRK